MTAPLYWLTLTALMTAVLAFPYVLERIVRVGMFPALGHNPDSGTSGFDQPTEKAPAWAKRAHAAHRNALESLPVFAALVLTAHLTGVGVGAGAGAALVALAAKTHFFARLVHYIVYSAGVPGVRTLAFFVALGALFAIGYAILVPM